MQMEVTIITIKNNTKMKTILEMQEFYSMLTKATTIVTKTEKTDSIKVYFNAYTEGKSVIIEEIHSGYGGTFRRIYTIPPNKVPADVFTDIKSGKYNYTMTDTYNKKD